MSNRIQRHAVGTQYLSHAKHPRVCTVTDFMTVCGLDGEIVRTYYQSEHEFMGQTVTEREVCGATIARGAFRLEQLEVVDARK